MRHRTLILGAATLTLACVAPDTYALAQLVADGPLGGGATTGGGVINIGQAFGWLQPYVDAAVQSIIVALVGWVVLLVKQHLGIKIDEGYRVALQTALQNQASSLIADGRVRLDGIEVHVDSPAIAAAANFVIEKGAPAAVAHFGITPELVAQKIKDSIPQIPAMAPAIAAAHAAEVVAKA